MDKFKQKLPSALHGQDYWLRNESGVSKKYDNVCRNVAASSDPEEKQKLN